MFGIHAANIGGVPALMANVDDIVCNIIYKKLKAKPNPKYIPIPPLRLRDDRDAPIIVRMKEAKRLLAMTDEPVARVGELSGYPDQFY